MGRNNDTQIETIKVKPCTAAEGTLSAGKVLRFERQGHAMAGTPVLCVEDGAVALHYADGASVYINA